MARNPGIRGAVKSRRSRLPVTADRSGRAQSRRRTAARVYCTAELKIPRQSPALIVPASGIIFDQNRMQVTVIENGVAHLRKIAITADYGTEVEVSDGVKQGDQAVLSPPVDLEGGSKVQIRITDAAH